jgi:ABC-type proline/glycine betaine transport system permease subunit
VTSLISLATYLALVALTLYALYWVVNRAVLHALRTHHAEVRVAAAPDGSHRPGG